MIFYFCQLPEPNIFTNYFEDVRRIGLVFKQVPDRNGQVDEVFVTRRYNIRFVLTSKMSGQRLKADISVT